MVNIDFSLVWFLVKILYMTAFGVYLVFATVVVKQVNQMTATLQVGFEFPIRVLAWAHFFLAIGIFIFALLTL